MAKIKARAWARWAGTGLALAAATTLAVSSVHPAAQTAGGEAGLPPVPSVKILTGTPVTPAAAAAYYGSSTASSDGLCALAMTADQFCAGGVLVRAPELKVMARGLKAGADFAVPAQQQETADRIYEYVRNSIDTEFMFGLHKGALGAAIDRSGTAFDQAELMVELMRESGLSASYRYGTISLSGEQVTAWTGLDRASAVCDLLATGGIPFVSAAGCGAGAIGQVTLSHVWVQATVGGNAYLYDPSYKVYRHKAGLGRAALHSAMGLNAGGARNAAVSGMSQGSQSGVPYVAGLNGSNLGATLQTYSNGLLARMNQSDLQGADLSDVIGGREIEPVIRPADGWKQSGFSYGTDSLAHWTGGVPNQFRATLGIVADRASEKGIISQNFYVDEIYGRRLEIDSYASSYHAMGSVNHTPRLLLDRVPVAVGTETNTTHLTHLTLHLAVNHPFAADGGGFGDVTIKKSANVLMAVAIVHGWGNVSRTLGAKWEDEQFEDGYAPQTQVCNGAEECDSSQTLRDGDLLRARIGAGWLAQFSRAAEINAELGRARVIHHHSVGIVSAEYMTTSAVYVPPPINEPAPNQPIGYTVADETSVVDLETSFGLVSRSSEQVDRRAAIHALALTAATLEGAVLEQLSQTPDAASTARRFAWGNAPDSSLIQTGASSFETTKNESPDMTSRRVYRYADGAAAAVASSLVRFENLSSGVHGSCGSCAADDPIEQSVADSFKSRLSDTIQAYGAAGFDVTASSEALLGPGHRQGPEYLSSVFYDEISNRRSYKYKRKPSLQSGGALIANKYDASGNPTEIAHVLTRISGVNKGGGGPSVGMNNPVPSADKMRDQFVDRSSAAGVDLMTGRASWRSPTLISQGQGDFPHKLETRVEFRGDQAPTDITGQGGDDPQRRTFVSNWDGSASIAGSGLEAMGESRIQAAAVTIAALSAMQDIFRDAPENQREVVAALTADWWVRKIRFNTVTISQGASSEQYLASGDGTWLAAAGGGGKVTISALPQLVRPSSGLLLRPGFPEQNESLTRYWLFDNVVVSATSAEGDTRAYDFWSKRRDGSPSIVNRHWGFRLKEWRFPSGVDLSIAYGNAILPGTATSVSSNLGLTVPAFPTEAGALYGKQFQDSGGNWHRVTVYGGAYRNVLWRPVASLRVGEVYQPRDLNTPSLRYFYGITNAVVEARDAIAVADTSARGTHKFFIAEGYRGERVDPLGGRYAVETLSGGRLQRHIDEMGRVSTATYDGRKRLLSRTSSWGDVTTFKYDGRDNIIEKTQAPKAGCGTDTWWCQTITTKAEYHPTWNKPTKIILPATIGGLAEVEWTFAYNAQGLVQEQRSPAVFNARNNQNEQAVIRSWYDGFGRLTKTQDPTGVEASQVWGGGGLPAYCLRQLIASSQSGGLNLTTTFGCNAAGDVTSVTDPRGNTTTTTYDALRRKTAEVGPASTGIQTQWVYDLNGNVVEEKKWEAPANVWRTTATTYSLMGKPLTVTDPSGDVSRTCYDALDRAVVAVDPTGRATRTSYNAASQPTEVERWFTANVGDAACALTDARPEGINTHIWRKYEYNAAGLQSAEIDANGNRTQMTYDGLGRPIVTTFADGAEAWSISDQRGQAVISKTRGGDYRDAYFDQLGRIHHVWEHAAADAYLKGRNTRTGYDLAGRPVWKDVSTQPTATWDESLRRDVHIYGYDTAGRPTTDQVQPMDAAIGTEAKTLTYGYDAASNRTSITWPDGFAATYAFDTANRPQTVSFGGHTATVAYDSLGRRTGVTRSSGANSAYAYEADGDLLSLAHNWSSGSGQAAASWTYGHDAAGRLTETDVTRLELEWMPPLAYAKAYGPANNLNQVASQAGEALAFNANGNLSTFQGATYTWALGNRLAGVSRPGMTASYAYDGEDRRTMKVVDGVTTRTLWSGADEVAEMDAAGNILRRFIPDGSGAMDGRLASLEANGTIHWHHTDHQGSVVATSNASGAPVSLVNYSPNGELGTAADGTALTAPPTGSPFGYTGRQYDPETGLWQYRARYYHPQLGQFLSTDPIGTKDDPNLYMYVANDPMNRTDPTGMQTAQCAPNCYAEIVISDGPTGQEIARIPIPKTPLTEFVRVTALVGVALGQEVLNNDQAADDRRRGSRPTDAPRGTRPIDESGIDRGGIHGVKDGIGARPDDWVGVTPDGGIVTTDPQTGGAVDQGNISDHGVERDRGRRGGGRDQDRGRRRDDRRPK